ncbi:thioester reductase domain-containing protein [Aquincola sp. MAHUQ-54]|uniref:Thioester reductase domain-containing protein n=1 Tax=Aquincola agrisoli TaxID=3119538 RepID=A0AAW9Q8W2_9BURK
MTTAHPPQYLRHNVIAEPLVNQWYAWSYLLPPATAARYLTESQLPVMASFVEAPEVHIAALRDPAMMGGPFIQYGTDRVPEMRALLARTRSGQRELIALSAAIAQLERLLAAHPAGESMDGLYARLPEALRGYVELVTDARNHPSARWHEGLLYRSGYWRPDNQSIALRQVPDSDRRAFVMSTPRLDSDVDVALHLPFADPALDVLFAARHTPVDVHALADRLGLHDGATRRRFAALFTTEPPRTADPWRGPGVRVRYLGHACVLVETPTTTVLVDPLVSYEHPEGLPRFSLADLPTRIDYALITHNHQDHVMLETLLQLRHRIGQVVVPAGHRGSLLDPSLRLALKQIGFTDVREIDRLEDIAFDGGRILSLPVLGEHGDLDIATKTAWWIEAEGRSVLCAADSNNLDSALYDHVAQLCGPLDLLFIGMECEGAPFTWAYGPLLPVSVPHAQAQARRLNGSNADRGMGLIERLQPAEVCVYAMGMEPWLNYITSIHYDDTSMAIVESGKLVERCRARGLPAQRLLGCAEFHFAPTARSHTAAAPLPASTTIDAEAASAAAPAIAMAPRVTAPAAPTPPADDPLGRLLDTLQQQQIRLHVQDGKLRVNAPQGALTDALKAELQQRKPALMALLGARAPGGAPATGAGAPSLAELPPDAHLPPDLTPLPWPGTQGPGQPPRDVLLTGATGFIGSYLLHELLLQTDARIHCLLRLPEGMQPADAAARLRTALEAIGRWEPAHAKRLAVIAGDLSQPRLGLGETEWQALAQRIDTIWHNGAHVHHLMPYEQLRAANIGGTLALMQLASIGRPKRLHHVSSLSVLPPLAQAGGRRFLETDALPAQPVPAGGYNRSKWVAEQLVRQAMARGLAATIYRPGPISGDSATGAFNRNDFLIRLMQGYLRSGIAPQGELPLDLLPVDWLARAMVHAGAQPAARGATLHLLHPQPVSSQVLFDACAAAGHAVRRVPYADWYRELQRVAREAPEHPLYPLVALFGGRAEGGDAGAPTAPTAAAPHATPYDSSVMRALLQGTPFTLPALDQPLFATYLRAMDRTGLLPDRTGASLPVEAKA